jgi:hypothetical protein
MCSPVLAQQKMRLVHLPKRQRICDLPHLSSFRLIDADAPVGRLRCALKFGEYALQCRRPEVRLIFE